MYCIIKPIEVRFQITGNFHDNTKVEQRLIKIIFWIKLVVIIINIYDILNSITPKIGSKIS